MKADLSFEEEKIRYPQLSILPFESERGFMATLHQDNGKKIIFVKGVPEKVIELCSWKTRENVGSKTT